MRILLCLGCDVLLILSKKFTNWYLTVWNKIVIFDFYNERIWHTKKIKRHSSLHSHFVPRNGRRIGLTRWWECLQLSIMIDKENLFVVIFTFRILRHTRKRKGKVLLPLKTIWRRIVTSDGIQHNRDTLAAFNIKNAIVNDTSTKKKKVTKSKEFFDIVKMKASYNEFCVMERYLLSV